MYQHWLIFMQLHHTPPQPQLPTQRRPAANTGTGVCSGKVSCSSAWFLTMPCPSLPTGVGTQPQLLAGQGAWHRAGCTGALAALPAEGLGELSRLHIHSRVC